MGKKRRATEERAKELRVPMEGEVICIVIEIIGADHLRVRCMDGAVRVCRIPGKFRRRVWISEGDLVLILPWDFQPSKGEVVHKYSRDEVKRLLSMGLVSQELLELGTE